jgi:hypothetical protein
MEVIKSCTFCPEGVQVGGANSIIAHAGEISFPLIIGQDEENIGATAGEFQRLSCVKDSDHQRT